MKKGIITKVSGPLVVAKGMFGARMYDVVGVSEKRLIGEIIELKEDRASIQVYEETSGIGPGEVVYMRGEPLSVELGPGLIGSIYDGIQRPLPEIRQRSGDYISRGLHLPGLDRTRKWAFKPLLKKGVTVKAGDILGEVPETTLVVHKIMVPPGIEGRLEEILHGKFSVEENIARIKTPQGKIVGLSMLQRWPVRRPRPIKERLAPNTPLITGQRVIDTLFPIAKGGTACIPGPFGSGKTVCQHQFAKWADSDIVVYVACGERGNEAADVILSFPELKDPRSGESLMKRTILIANTSNMPVSAREASIYTGITIGEYFRDMGYSVAVMADSTSRWAEALREISGRLEEMPGEEGYPAYLSYRIAEFYERAGRIKCLGQDLREGSISIMGAVSPPGGDLSDPVVQATLRMVKAFWGLEDKLAQRRHFPAINWLLSYSLYLDNLKDYFNKEVVPNFIEQRTLAMRILEEESKLEEIARLVGIDTLSSRDRLILETARSIREDFLHQNAFHEVDTYTSLDKQYRILETILTFHREAEAALNKKVPLEELTKLSVRSKIARAKYIPENKTREFDSLKEELLSAIKDKIKEKGEASA